MLYIPCPNCGHRNETEFHYGSEAGVTYPDPGVKTVSDEQWAAYLFIRANSKGWFHERWVHFAGCGRWFSVWRNTVTHEFKAADVPQQEEQK